jgi:REP element-mobilizing transposase RayT
MSHSYASNRIHLIFSTKNREKRISVDLQTKLWPYMAGIARHHGFEAIKVGGVEDHAHALLLLPPTIALAKAVQILKACSSKWINDTHAGKDFAWQEGYGAFSVSASQTEDVIKYIEGQAAHHARRSYEDEFLELLKRYGVAYDPAHVFG